MGEEQKDPTIDAYNKIAAHYSDDNYDDSFWSLEFDHFTKYLDGYGKSGIVFKVLDVGCGAGRDAILFHREEFYYLGIDASEEMLNIAKTRVPKAEFRLMDFYSLKISDNEFDCFWASASLLHAPKNRAHEVLNEIKRVIKPGGIGFISIRKRHDLSEGYVNQSKSGEDIKRYFAFYKESEFSKLLSEVGIEILAIEKKEEDGREWLIYYVRV